jgi:hypothetical protein
MKMKGRKWEWKIVSNGKVVEVVTTTAFVRVKLLISYVGKLERKKSQEWQNKNANNTKNSEMEE